MILGPVCYPAYALVSVPEQRLTSDSSEAASCSIIFQKNQRVFSQIYLSFFVCYRLAKRCGVKELELLSMPRRQSEGGEAAPERLDRPWERHLITPAKMVSRTSM